MDMINDDDDFLLRAIDSSSNTEYEDSTKTPLAIADEAVLRRYKQLSVEVYTQNSYAAISTGPLPSGFNYGNFSRAFNEWFHGEETVYDWKPAYSGKAFRHLLLFALWLTVLTHYNLSILGLKDGAQIHNMACFAPAVIATALTWLTVTVVAAEIRREKNRVTSSLRRRRYHREALHHFRWMILYIIAPILSVPLQTIRYISVPTNILPFRPHIELLTFSTWTEMAQQFQSQLPIGNGILPVLKGDTQPVDVWKSWRIPPKRTRSKDPSWRDLIDVDSVLKFSGSEVRHNITEGEALVMPLYIPDQVLDSTVIYSTIRAYLKALSSIVECQAVNHAKGTTWSLSTYRTINFENCRGTFKVDAIPVTGESRSELIKAYQEEIPGLEKWFARTGLHYVRLRLIEHRKSLMILQSGDALHVLQPVWGTWDYVKGGNGTKACSSGLAFLGDDKSFRRVNETEIPEQDLSMAYCDTHFFEFQMHFVLNLRPSGLIKRLTSLPSSWNKLRLNGVWLGAMRITGGWRDYKTETWPSSIVNWVVSMFRKEPWHRTPLWTQVKGAGTEGLDTLSRSIADSIRYGTVLDTSKWPQQLLHTSWSSYDKEIPALNLGSKMLCAWIVEQLSESADLALTELLKVSPKPRELKSLPGELSSTHLIRRNHASYFWLNAAFLVILIICTERAWSSSMNSNDSPSGVPWSIETIAARACLIVRSRLRHFFSHPDREPWDLYIIPGLKLGRWTRDEGHSRSLWYLDSHCNEVLVDPHASRRSRVRDVRLWKRHDMKSVTLWAHPTLLVACFGLFLSMATSVFYFGIHTQRRELKQAIRSHIVAILSENLAFDPGWFTIIACLATPQFLAFYLFGIWNNLDIFYSARQPWANLAKGGVAHNTLTLDYTGRFSRFRRAYRNKDYLIVFLTVGNVLTLVLPILSAGIFQLETYSKRVALISGKKAYSWDLAQEDISFASYPQLISASTMNSIIKPPTQIDWVIEEEALSPVTLETDLIKDTPLKTYWRAETTSLRSNLSCVALSTSSQHETFDGKSGQQPQQIVVALPKDSRLRFADNKTRQTLPSCRGDFAQLTDSSSVTGKVSCWEWILAPLAYDWSIPEPEIRTSWIITFVDGELDSWDSRYGLLLKAGYSSRAMACSQDIFLSTGIVELVQDTDEASGDTTVKHRKFEPNTVLKIEESHLHQSFARLLNDSLHNPFINNSDFRLRSNTIASSPFVGDLMGYLLYRSLQTYKANDDKDMSAMGEYVSLLYSKVFASFVTENAWPKREAASSVQVEQMQWSESWRINKVISTITLLLLCFFATSIGYMSCIRKKYMFPAAPEPLENSLFFLYQSSIIKMLESIPSPEKLSIDDLHREVEAFGHRYAFGMFEDTATHHAGYGVDRIGEPGFLSTYTTAPMEEEHAPAERRYRDEEPESSDDSSVDSRSTTQTRKDKKQKKKKKSSRDRHDTEDDTSAGENSREESSEQNRKGKQRASSDDHIEEEAIESDIDDPLEITVESNVFRRSHPPARPNIMSQGIRRLLEIPRLVVFPSVKHLADLGKGFDDDSAGSGYALDDFPSLIGLKELRSRGGGVPRGGKGSKLRRRRDIDAVYLSDDE